MELLSNCDSLSEQFFNSFNVSKPRENDTLRPHPKYWRLDSRNSHDHVKRIQNDRRKEFLDRIARKRQEILLKLRPLERLFDEDDENEKIADCSTESASSSKLHSSSDSVEHDVPMVGSENLSIVCKKKKSRARKPKNILSQQIMLSEWLVDVPEDFYTNWFMVCCPVGKRTLIFSGAGKTKIFSRNGNLLLRLSWSLDGTKSANHSKRSRPIILDAIYVESEHTFYILDVLTWNGHSVHDCEAQFRFYWLRAKFNEDLSTLSQSAQPQSMQIDDSVALDRRPRFVPLDYHECNPANIRNVLRSSQPFNMDIDGVLFYQKDAPYIPGINPLVLWLKVHMIADILKIDLQN